MKTLLFILLFSFTAFGQSVEQLREKAKSLKAKDIYIVYDKYKDSSLIETKPYNLIGGMEGGLAMVASNEGRNGNAALVLAIAIKYLFKGNALDKTPDKYYFVIMSASYDWQYLKGDTNAYILCDEKRIELHPVAKDDNVFRSFGGPTVSEEIAFEISPADLKILANGKDVSMEFGSRPRKFKKELLERFGKILALTGN